MFKKQLQDLSLSAITNGGKDTNPDQTAKTETAVISELIKPSIFDTEEMKRIKGLMIEVQEYIGEIDFMRKN